MLVMITKASGFHGSTCLPNPGPILPLPYLYMHAEKACDYKMGACRMISRYTFLDGAAGRCR